MKKLIVSIILALAITPAYADFVKGEILVKFKDNKNSTQYNSKKVFNGTKIHVISVPENTEEKVVEALSHNPNIEIVELNEIHEPSYLPNDPKIGSQWWLNTINALEAMDTSEGNNVIVGVCDSAFNNHEDLQGVLLNGWNFYGNNSDVSNPNNGHGTGVAGIIAANTHNNLGVAAPANKVSIIPGRIGDDSSNAYATYSNMVACAEYMADRGASVINFSYGGACGSVNATAARYANSKNATVHWAAGNDNSQLTCSNVEEQTVVSATNSSNVRASFSNYGAAIDLAAPGQSVYGLYGNGTTYYSNLNGTSFSSPITAAVAAMVYSKNPGITASQVRAALYNTATDLGNISYYGHGLVNALEAVNYSIDVGPICGNGILEGNEQCDDGNTINGDGCDNKCLIEITNPICGNGIVEENEQCDDGNTTNGDGCNSNCLIEIADTTPPTIEINKPREGEKTRRLNLRGKAIDETELDYTEVYLNNGLVSYINMKGSTIANINYSWSGTKGNHTLRIVVFDVAGNEAETSINFSIK